MQVEHGLGRPAAGLKFSQLTSIHVGRKHCETLAYALDGRGFFGHHERRPPDGPGRGL
jgi:hypothetical protein